jgi:hypothetical protein
MTARTAIELGVVTAGLVPLTALGLSYLALYAWVTRNLRLSEAHWANESQLIREVLEALTVVDDRVNR